MQISFYKKSDTEASITIKIEEDDYQARVAGKIREYSKKASIKGFRPGSVPTALVQQMYGHAILVEEVNALLVESLEKYLRENEIHALYPEKMKLLIGHSSVILSLNTSSVRWVRFPVTSLSVSR